MLDCYVQMSTNVTKHVSANKFLPKLVLASFSNGVGSSLLVPICTVVVVTITRFYSQEGLRFRNLSYSVKTNNFSRPLVSSQLQHTPLMVSNTIEKRFVFQKKILTQLIVTLVR